MKSLLRRGLIWSSWLGALALVACSSTPVNHAPVDDRSQANSVVAPVVATPVKPPPGFENAGKPGFYTVKPGDTLIRIGLENGQSHKDIARWNALDNPNRIEVGQVLRVVPPPGGDAMAVARPVTSGTVTTTPISSAPVQAASAQANAPAASAPASAASAPASASSGAVQVANAGPAVAVSAGEDDVAWIWPGKGAVLAEFNEAKNKGVDIGGAAGDPVFAAADGKVVYAGAGLRGYGNLIILKHNATFLTAYAHNQALLVKEDQVVKKGQKIAAMGSSDTDHVKLHFEIRRQGKPVDPMKYLPAR